MESFVKIHLTLYYEGSFWVGIFERTCSDSFEVARVVFGSEPKDEEVYQFLLENYSRVRFGRKMETEGEYTKKRVNPKRLQRQIKKYVKNSGAGTKAQEAIRLERELGKKIRKKKTKEEKERKKKLAFEMKQQKKREKKKGH